MDQAPEGLFFSIISISFLIVFLVLVLLNLLLTGRNRKLQHRASMLELQASTQKEISLARMEVAEQTMTEVAQDLHDDVGQLLMFSMIHINLLRESPENSAEHMDEVQQALQRAVDSLRAISKNLSRDYILNAGITTALSRLFDQLKKQPAVEANGAWPADLKLASPEKELFLFRIIQECITNTLKHAGADKLDLKIGKTDNRVQLIYTDNGKGIPEANTGIHGEHSVGLSSMFKRAELLNGDLQITNNVTGGIKISLDFLNI